jgi:hypothetical protein
MLLLLCVHLVILETSGFLVDVRYPTCILKSSNLHNLCIIQKQQHQQQCPLTKSSHTTFDITTGAIASLPSSSTVLLSSNDGNNRATNDDKSDDDNDDDGAKLAAAFFRTAQSKGINIDATDLQYDDDDDDEEEEDDAGTDEEDDDDDDDGVEPNIPQGAINAFLGYDTGNVGEKLAGNVTLTNDQLYSEVKERVLESAGGFLSFVKGATDDDDEEEEEDDDELISDANKPYVVPTTVPDSELTAGEVVILVLEALRNNDTPTINKGVEILFGYSSPGSQIKNEIGLTPAEYAEFLKETEYKILFTNVGPIHIDKADYSFDGKKAFFTARLQTSIDNPLDAIPVNFILSTTGREDDACWLIDSLLIRPQAMRRRRRK